MSFLPTSNLDNIKIENKTKDIQPSKTYKIDFTNNRIAGFLDGIDALNQSIIKILSTERYQKIIYNSDYGVEFQHIINGNYTESFIKTEIERTIKEALKTDNRILSVENFEFNFGNDYINVKFDINSIFGEISREEVLNVRR